MRGVITVDQSIDYSFKANTVIREMCLAKDPACVADEFKNYQV